jgi:Zn-finger nucleic acid-binding protein
MNCPVCNHSLEAEKYQYLPYLCCKQCGGMWVDSKMLKHLATRLAAEKGVKPAKSVSLSPIKALRTPPKEERIRLCPKCGAAMKKLNYAYDSNVFIDRCAACDDIWLDKGEMMQLAAYHQIDENAIITGKALLDIQNEPEKTGEEIQLCVTIILILLRIFFRF